MSALEDLGTRMRRTGAPVTVALIGLLALTYVLAWFGLRTTMGSLLTFMPAEIARAPWTIATYPFASLGNGNDLFWFLLTLLWLWFMGSSVEREVGPQRFVGIWVAFTLLGAASIWLASVLVSGNVGLFGAMIPIAAITMIWCARNPEAQILLMAIIPFKGKWLAWLTALLVFFNVGNMNPPVGFFGLLPVVLAWMYGAERIPGIPYSAPIAATPRSRADRQRDEEREWAYRESVKQREKERQERERLRKLFESSIQDDEPDR